MRKHWRRIAFIGVLLILAFCGFSIYQGVNLRNKNQSLQTYVLTRGTLSASVGATGTITARQQASMSFSISGRVGTVNVKLGDRVRAGQVLIELDPAYYPQQVDAAQIDLINAQKDLDKLKSSNAKLAQAELDLANAKQNLDTAQTEYDEALKNNNDGWLKDCEDRVAQTYADYMYYRYHNDGSPAAMRELQRRYQAYLDALRELEKARQYHDLGIGTSGGTKESEMQLEIAKAKLNLAQAQYDDALANYDRLKNGVPSEDLRAAQARVDAAQAVLDQAKITAPFSGTITAVNLLPGDVVTPGAAALVIADLSELHVDVPIAEVDYNRLVVGQNAELVLDAIPNMTYHGEVTQIGLNASNTGGSVSYPIRVVISDADPSVLPGMTVAVQIEVSHLENVLMVPNRAVRNVNGELVVYVLQNGEQKMVLVELGASNDTMSEVVKGDLKEGDLVILNPSTSLLGGSSNSNGGGRARGLFGG
jgi:HlyD family secretion protein